MYSNSEYSSLLAQLNRANAEIMNLKDQVRYYREHKEEREAEIKRDNGFIRSFCEKVLSKDSDEMVTGREYSVCQSICSSKRLNIAMTSIIVKEPSFL